MGRNTHPATALLQWEASLPASKLCARIEAFVNANEGFMGLKFQDTEDAYPLHYAVISIHGGRRMYERNCASSETAILAMVTALVQDTTILDKLKEACLIYWDSDHKEVRQEGEFNAAALVRDGMEFVPIIQIGEQHLYIRTLLQKKDHMFFKDGTMVMHFDKAGNFLNF